MEVRVPHILQAFLGMVQNNGAPQQRRFPGTVADIYALGGSSRLSTFTRKIAETENDSHGLLDIAVEYLQSAGPMIESQACAAKLRAYAANLAACRSNVTPYDLKLYMKSRTRLDLEQAVAVVIAAFVMDGRTDNAIQLIEEVSGILSTAHMWIDPTLPLPMTRGPFVIPTNLAKKLQLSAAKNNIDTPLAISYVDLVPLLSQVRRYRPDDRCLNIPKWMFEEAAMEPPAQFKAFFANKDRTKNPVAPRDQESIIVSRKHFLAIQRHIYHYYRYWKLEINLRKQIKKLEERVLFGAAWLNSCLFTDVNDVGVLAHHFFTFQRRLQRKVVSIFTGNDFLYKGEAATIYQNNLATKSTFENKLREIAESHKEGLTVAIADNDTLERIDETCLLMKRYVDVYGSGKKENLTFKKGVSGGSGRGPVDDYNLLCNVLTQLKQQAKERGIVNVPGHTQKFLAKDIMAWNNAWEDDAFAGGRKAGWEDWVEQRALKAEDV